MKKRLVLAALAAMAIVSYSNCGSSTNSVQDLANLQAMIESKWAEYSAGKTNFGGGLALKIIVPKGEYFVATGMGDDATENIHFRSASTTKTFTAAAIMLLYQQGQLDIDDFITDLIPNGNESYVPDSSDFDIPYKSQITIRQLLGHRAGVFDNSNDDIPATAPAPYAGDNYAEYVRETLGEDDHTFTFDELVGVNASNDLSYFEPDTNYHYSNTGYVILGKIIERVSKLNYVDFIRDNLLIPNGLTDSSMPFEGTDQEVPAPFATGYLWWEDVLHDVTLDNMSENVAEGNLITTPKNLVSWIRLLISGSAGLSDETINTMCSGGTESSNGSTYGLGCMYIPNLGYGHNGGHQGYLTDMRYDPVSDIATVVFTTGFNGADYASELNFLYEVEQEARRVLGYQ